MDAIAKLRLELWVLRYIQYSCQNRLKSLLLAILYGEICQIYLFHREHRLHVPFAENLLEAFLVYVVDTGEAREVPGILVVIDGDGIALVKDDVACVGVDLRVVTRKTARQVGNLLETAVVVHVSVMVGTQETKVDIPCRVRKG